jgi:hypothetical protein
MISERERIFRILFNNNKNIMNLAISQILIVHKLENLLRDPVSLIIMNMFKYLII